MNFFRDTRLMVKAAIPQIVLALLRRIGALCAHHTHQSVRGHPGHHGSSGCPPEYILKLNIETNEASVVVRNMIIEKRDDKMEGYRVRYETRAFAASRTPSTA